VFRGDVCSVCGLTEDAGPHYDLPAYETLGSGGGGSLHAVPPHRNEGELIIMANGPGDDQRVWKIHRFQVNDDGIMIWLGEWEP
jgi:hypothetical protein